MHNSMSIWTAAKHVCLVGTFRMGCLVFLASLQYRVMYSRTLFCITIFMISKIYFGLLLQFMIYNLQFMQKLQLDLSGSFYMQMLPRIKKYNLYKDLNLGFFIEVLMIFAKLRLNFQVELGFYSLSLAFWPLVHESAQMNYMNYNSNKNLSLTFWPKLYESAQMNYMNYN